MSEFFYEAKLGSTVSGFVFEVRAARTTLPKPRLLATPRRDGRGHSPNRDP